MSETDENVAQDPRVGLLNAIAAMGEALEQAGVADRVGAVCSCAEADAIARVLACADRWEAAAAFVLGHASTETNGVHLAVGGDLGKADAYVKEHLRPWTEDDEFVQRALSGELGEEMQFHAQGVLVDHRYEEATAAEVAEAIRASASGLNDGVDLAALIAERRARIEANAEAAFAAWKYVRTVCREAAVDAVNAEAAEFFEAIVAYLATPRRDTE